MKVNNYSMKMIFHLPYQPDETRLSASQIRPFKMIQAFKEIGFEVALVMGSASRRKIQIHDIKQRIENGEKFDFLYSESSTMPTMLTEQNHLPTSPILDFAFFYFLKRRGVSIGLFYRDVHWKFQHYRINVFKAFISKFFYKLDLIIYRKLLDMVFLPSVEMAKYIPELASLKTYPLPPGCELPKDDYGISQSNPNKLKILYVGGLGDLYNLELFLDTISKQNEEKVLFTLCTRSSDFLEVKWLYAKYFEHKNLQLIHAGGEDLVKLYFEHDVCCLFVKPTQYWEFAMPVKLFEYISYKKPIIAVSNTAVGNYVASKKIGWVLDFDSSQLEILIKSISKDSQEYLLAKKNLEKVSEENTWKNRATFVSKLLNNI